MIFVWYTHLSHDIEKLSPIDSIKRLLLINTNKSSLTMVPVNVINGISEYHKIILDISVCNSTFLFLPNNSTHNRLNSVYYNFREDLIVDRKKADCLQLVSSVLSP